MRKMAYALTLIFTLSLMTACSLNHKENTLEEMSYRAAGYDKSNNLFQTYSAPATDSISQLEQRVNQIPGVSNANILLYPADNMIVGFNKDTNASYAQIEARVRQELQGEAKHFLVYLVNEQDPDLLARVKEIRSELRQGKAVSETEMHGLMEWVWKSIIPFNFLSKT